MEVDKEEKLSNNTLQSQEDDEDQNVQAFHEQHLTTRLGKGDMLKLIGKMEAVLIPSRDDKKLNAYINAVGMELIT